jgi:hypothetical protein
MVLPLAARTRMVSRPISMTATCAWISFRSPTRRFSYGKKGATFGICGFVPRAEPPHRLEARRFSSKLIEL